MARHRQGGILPMEKVREILRLKELGYNQAQIARSCLVARSTVQDYMRRATGMGVTYEQVKGLWGSFEDIIQDTEAAWYRTFD